MTPEETWDTIAGRLSANQPLDLDPLLAVSTTQPAPGGALTLANENLPPPSPHIWPLQDDNLVYLGIRLVTPLDDPAGFAARLIAMAGERGIYPVIFSALDFCGLEQFGLRVERLTGATAQQRDAREQELKQFFHISVVMDCENLLALA